jgi:hypothetical protein
MRRFVKITKEERIVAVNERSTLIFNLSILPLLAMFYSATVIANDTWTLMPAFSVDGSNYLETLSFVSGVAYGRITIH